MAYQKIPALGQSNMAGSLPVTLASDQSDVKVTLDSEAVVLGAGSAAIGKLAANSGVDIGDVDVTSLPDITGSVTANAGTNLNTSALALETGGNLASIKTNTDKIPALGQALAAASVPVVLPADQITTLTPPAAITGFATSAKQDTIIGHVDGIETVLGTIDADTSAIKTAVEIIDNAISGNEMQVDVVAALPAGTNNIGDVDLASAIPAGTNAIGKLLPPDVDVTAHTNYARKYYTNAGAVTDGIIWSPAAGKRWHVTTLYINVSAAATVTLEDDKAGGDEVVWKGELAANSGVVIHFGEKYPLASGEDAADLTVTTSAGNIYITCVGYEV